MSDTRPTFTILEDISTEAGLPLHKVEPGDGFSNVHGIMGLIAKDSSNNLQLLSVNSNNELLVNAEGEDYTRKKASGKVTGSASAMQDVCEITLDASKKHWHVSWSVGCYRDADFEIVHIADAEGTPVEDILIYPVVGPGDTNDTGQLPELEFTTGGTGVQKLLLRGINQNTVSDLRGTITVKAAA